MSRLEQKCAIASAGVHLLLFSVLLVGPAFMASKDKPDDMPILDFVALKTTDDMVSGGGNPNGGLPAPPPPPPPQVRQAPPAVKPEPEVAKPAPQELQHDDPAESSLIPATKKTRKPEISTKLVTRKPSTRTRSDEDSSAQEERAAQEYSRQRQRYADLLGKATSHLEHGVAGGTAIDIKDLKGPGGGGVPYANFYQAVKSVYARAWVLPDGIDDDEATTAASVTIARDGKVVSARIIRSSGNVAVDQSVRVVLDRVKFAAPLPDSEKADERTVTINFNVKAKKALG